MKVGIASEFVAGERRVALVPALVPALTKLGLVVMVETGAGQAAGFLDQDYAAQGAQLVSEHRDVFAADCLLRVHALPPDGDSLGPDEGLLRDGQTVIGFADPLGLPQRALRLAASGVTLISMELIPRITRAQSMDALSSMGTIAGYKAVLLAASVLPKMFPMMMTAAGTITPAKAFVVGAGVAGLQAIASARRLGAVVEAYDVRPVVKEQVESLGARFLETELETGEAQDAGGYAKELDEDFYCREREMMSQAVAENDVIITTAAVPGKKAPVLITTEMVQRMRPGSVLVDLVAERGGNCELTQPGQTVEHSGVTILGPVNLPSSVPFHASQMYAKNITALLKHLAPEGQLTIDLSDEITRHTVVTHEKQVVNARVRELLSLPPLPAAEAERAQS